MTQVFWYVYRVGGGVPRFKHTSYNSAVTEAKRLVDSVGGEYEVLEAKTVVKPAPKYVVEELCPVNGQTVLPHSSYCGCDKCIPF